MEGIVLLMVGVSPWMRGAFGPERKLYLFLAIAILLALWGIRNIVGRSTWKACPVAICLAAIIVVGVLQLVPMSTASLGWLSPGTADLYSRLLPTAPEAFAETKAVAVASTNVGSTVSVYPYATRKSLVDLIAVLSLFVVTRTSIASVHTLRRLCLVAVVNGAALSFFAIFTAVGWFEEDTSFGTFANHNHFAFYINCCLGLSFGLLLTNSHTALETLADKRIPLHGRLRCVGPELLANPASIWICGAIALMLCGVALCLSRGAYIAFIGSTLVCVLMARPKEGWSWGLISTLLTAALGLCALAWYGFDEVRERLATFWTGEAFGDDRMFLLTHSWRQIVDFPIWGTGYGTFQYVEPMKLHRPSDTGMYYIHAHNDYLEDLVEGGIVRLALRLVAIGLILRLGYLVIRRSFGSPLSSLGLGAVFAFGSMVIHSFFEFGLYLPAIAVLATVVCGQLCRLGDQVTTEHESVVGESDFSTASVKLTPVVNAIFALFLGWFLVATGLRSAQCSVLSRDARRMQRAAYEGNAEQAAEIPILEEAVRREPDDAEQRYALSSAHFDQYKLLTECEFADSTEYKTMAQHHLLAALKQVIHARDLCPLLPSPHARIGYYSSEFAKSDSREVYISRAKFLAPADPHLWYLCGIRELAQNQSSEAWNSWRQSLLLSDRFLTEIIERSIVDLSIEELIGRVLPENPKILLESALHLFPDPKAVIDREPFLDEALSICESQNAPGDADFWHTKATVFHIMGRHFEAVTAYQTALELDPEEYEWRFQLAQVFDLMGDKDKSLEQIRAVLSFDPNHEEARQGLKTLLEQMNGAH